MAKSFVPAMMSICCFLLKKRAKLLTAPLCHVDNQTRTHVPGQMHGRQSDQVINSRVFEFPAQLFATLATCKGRAGVTGEVANVDTILLRNGVCSAKIK